VCVHLKHPRKHPQVFLAYPGTMGADFIDYNVVDPIVLPNPGKVDVRLPGKGDSNSHGARPVHLIITMVKWIRTSRLSIKKSLPPSSLALSPPQVVPEAHRGFYTERRITKLWPGIEPFFRRKA